MRYLRSSRLFAQLAIHYWYPPSPSLPSCSKTSEHWATFFQSLEHTYSRPFPSWRNRPPVPQFPYQTEPFWCTRNFVALPPLECLGDSTELNLSSSVRLCSIELPLRHLPIQARRRRSPTLMTTRLYSHGPPLAVMWLQTIKL